MLVGVAPVVSFHREVLEHFNLEIPEGRAPTEEEEEIQQVNSEVVCAGARVV